MMQAIVETLFDAVYLISVITIGILMIRGSKGERQFKLFGWMAVVLGGGIPFIWFPGPWHCVPPGWRITRFPWDWANGSPLSP